jgi:hypothetical protein
MNEALFCIEKNELSLRAASRPGNPVVALRQNQAAAWKQEFTLMGRYSRKYLDNVFDVLQTHIVIR